MIEEESNSLTEEAPSELGEGDTPPAEGQPEAAETEAAEPGAAGPESGNPEAAEPKAESYGEQLESGDAADRPRPESTVPDTGVDALADVGAPSSSQEPPATSNEDVIRENSSGAATPSGSMEASVPSVNETPSSIDQVGAGAGVGGYSATDEASAVDATAEQATAEEAQPPRPREISVVKMNTGLDDLPDDLSPEDFESAIEKTVLEFKEGDLIEGTIVRIDHDEALVDIGYKSEGVIPANELSIRNNANPGDVVKIGDVVEAMVLEMEDAEGRLILSKKRAQYERAWGTIEGIMHEKGTVKGPVIEVVKGGLIVDIGLRGFLPASLVELRRVRDLQPYVGEEIEAKVIELDKNRNNVVLSRRAYLEDEQAEQRHAFLGDLAEGDIREGVVSSVVNFGAFVDLGGMDGLVHVSELSWQHVTHPSEVVTVGDKVQVKVLEVDRDRERISLSIRQTREDPWATFAEAYGVGSILDGKVTKTVPFGAFVSVTDGVEGLVHVSEIALHHVESPELELSMDQPVKVKITEIDAERRRISLSIKQAMPEWQDRQQAQPQAPSRPQKKRPERSNDYTSESEETTERSPHFTADASLEAILQELKEKGIGN